MMMVFGFGFVIGTVVGGLLTRFAMRRKMDGRGILTHYDYGWEEDRVRRAALVLEPPRASHSSAYQPRPH